LLSGFIKDNRAENRTHRLYNKLKVHGHAEARPSTDGQAVQQCLDARRAKSGRYEAYCYVRRSIERSAVDGNFQQPARSTRSRSSNRYKPYHAERR